MPDQKLNGKLKNPAPCFGSSGRAICRCKERHRLSTRSRKPWRCSMARLLRWLEAIGLALWVCGLGVPATAAARTPAHCAAHRFYLPAAGPSPLRFQAPRPVSRLVLPPLPSPDRPGAGMGGSATNPAPPDATSLPATNRPVSAVRVMGPAPLPAPSPRLEGLPSLPAPEDQTSAATQGIDPRLLLEYLAPLPTTGPARNGLPGPVFIPPVAPPAPRSSQATYESR
jgi:hypothetical protein